MTVKKLKKNKATTTSDPKPGLFNVVFTSTFRRPELLFLYIATIFGLIFIFVTPPFQAPDEQSHYYKSYYTSTTGVVPEHREINGQARYGATLPSSLKSFEVVFKADIAGQPSAKFNTEHYKDVTQPLNLSVKEFIPFDGAAIYSPVAYIPQALGMLLGRVFEASPLALMWLGRIANLVVWIALIFIAIKKIPFAKWALVIAALNPLSLFLAASLSADAPITALTILFIALAVRTAVSPERMSRGIAIALISLAILLALTKPVSILMVLVLFVISPKKFKSLSKYFIFIGSAILLAFAAGLIWNVSVGEAVQALGSIHRPGSDISPSGQVHYIFANMFDFVKNIIQNYIVVTPGFNGNDVLWSFFGVFGWLDSRLPLWTILLYVIGLVVAILYQSGRGKVLSFTQKAVLLSVILLTALGTIAALYLNYTPVGQPVIDGVQGRYFIPLAPLALAILVGRKKILLVTEKRMMFVTLVTTGVTLTVTLLILIARYY